jgi:flagellar biosynthesis protein FliR
MSKILLTMLALSFVYGAAGLAVTLAGRRLITAHPVSHYVKVILECLLGVFALFLPSALEHRFKVTFPNAMHIIFVVFLYAAVILGEVQGFYRRFFHWDTVLHTLSGAMLASFGFSIIDIINRSERINLGLSDWFMSFFSFCFAVMLDTLWEIVEFCMDAFLSLNMQQYILPNGTVLAGHAAVVDTMKDLIVDVLGALCISVMGYILLKKRRPDTQTQGGSGTAKEKPALRGPDEGIAGLSSL